MPEAPGAPASYQWSSFALVASFVWLMLGALNAETCNPNHWRGVPPQPTPAVMSDRLAQPLLGESPTQVEFGRYLYYFNCMPCHGDRGQGLTDEWRQVWVEDHRDCWARGCHTGKSELSSFYIPRVVPPVVGLGHFQEAGDLFAFLRATQPPQRPGALSDSEYWALTAFLLYEDGRLSPDAAIGPEASAPNVATDDMLVTMSAILLALFVGFRAGKRQGKVIR